MSNYFFERIIIMKIIKKICAICCSILISLNICLSAIAKDTIVRSKTITSTNKDDKVVFDEEIEEDGKKYIYNSVSYEIREQEDKNAQKKVKKEVKEGLNEEYYNWPETISVNDSGKNYTASLDSSTIQYSSEGQETHTEEIKGTKTYEGYDMVDVPQTATFNVNNPFSGEAESLTLPLTDTDETYTWDEDFELEYLFTNYNSKRYNIAGTIFYHNDKVCPLNDDIDFVYELFSLSKEDYEIVSIEWDGKADESSNTRNSIITARRKVKTIKAYYSEKHTFYGNESYTGEADYVYTISNNLPVYEITAKAVYEEKETKKTKTTNNTKANEKKPRDEKSDTQTTTTSPTLSEIEEETSSAAVAVLEDDSDISSTTKSEDRYFEQIETPSDEDKEKNNGFIYIIIGIMALVSTGIILLLLGKKANVYDENLQLIGHCKLAKKMELSEFFSKTNKNISIKAGQSFIKKNRKLELRAFGESLSYSFDGAYIEVINPNNYTTL